MKIEKFKPIPCDEHQLKSIMVHKTLWWILGTMFTLTMGLVGVIYSSVDSRINSKADKALVEQMQTEVHDLWLMHINEGYKSKLKGQ